MEIAPTPAAIKELFDNDDPQQVWMRSVAIIRRMNPGYDFALVLRVFQDVVRVFHGDYPGYGRIKTLYHDLPHTLEVFMCGVRLMHGVHVSGVHLDDDEITLIMLAILMHDIGYAQRLEEDTGSGAQFTLTHVERGIEFMQGYFSGHPLPAAVAESLSNLMLGTEHNQPFTRIGFRDERALLLGRIVATADITGQMADRIYLEKLLFLYLEFKEAQFGSFNSMFDLLSKTHRFYEMTREKLDVALAGTYRYLEDHFRDTLGVSTNFYLQAIEKNIAYLSTIVAHDEQELYALLKRNGIAEKSRNLF